MYHVSCIMSHISYIIYHICMYIYIYIYVYVYIYIYMYIIICWGMVLVSMARNPHRPWQTPWCWQQMTKKRSTLRRSIDLGLNTSMFRECKESNPWFDSALVKYQAVTTLVLSQRLARSKILNGPQSYNNFWCQNPIKSCERIHWQTSVIPHSKNVSPITGNNFIQFWCFFLWKFQKNVRVTEGFQSARFSSSPRRIINHHQINNSNLTFTWRHMFQFHNFLINISLIEPHFIWLSHFLIFTLM